MLDDNWKSRPLFEELVTVIANHRPHASCAQRRAINDWMFDGVLYILGATLVGRPRTSTPDVVGLVIDSATWIISFTSVLDIYSLLICWIRHRVKSSR